MLTYINAFLLLDIVVATPWIGAMETPVGIEAVYAISPRPTEAPGLNGIPRELLRRAGTSIPQYPPPDSWCGFVGGDSDSILSCGPRFTCKYSGTAVGCCTNDAQFCTNLFTSCAASTDICGTSCQSNPFIIKCTESASAYCGVYAFSGGKHLYNCQETPLSTQTVEFLADWYLTGISSTLLAAPSSSGIATKSPTFSLEPVASSDVSDTRTTQSSTSATRDFGGTTGRQSSSPTSTPEASSHHGIAAGAIGGIVAGAGVLAIAAAILIFLCIRKRNKNQAAAQNHQPRPAVNGPSQPSQPMQEQTPLAVPGYQNPPPRESQYGPPQGGYMNPQTPGSSFAVPVSHGPSSPTQSQFNQQDFEHRASTVTNPFSPVPSTINGSDTQHHGGSENGYFHPSPSPTPAIPEVDNKMGKSDYAAYTSQSQSQSPPPMISEVPGSNVNTQSYTQSQPMQHSQSYTQTHQQTYTQGQQMHGGYNHAAQEMPGAHPQPGPWELPNRE